MSSQNQEKSKGDTWTVIVLLIVLLGAIVALVASCEKEERREYECVQGGYGAVELVKGVRLCLGINSDGEWIAEPLSDVRERLGKD